MKKEYKKILLQRWTKLILVLTLVYFSQIYPYIHLHHSHDGDLLPFEISFIPIDVKLDNLPDHHDGEDHHHALDVRFDWHFIRAHSQSVLSSVKQVYFLCYSIDEPDNNILAGSINNDRPIECQINLIHPLEIRGPPLLG